MRFSEVQKNMTFVTCCWSSGAPIPDMVKDEDFKTKRKRENEFQTTL